MYKEDMDESSDSEEDVVMDVEGGKTESDMEVELETVLEAELEDDSLRSKGFKRCRARPAYLQDYVSNSHDEQSIRNSMMKGKESDHDGKRRKVKRNCADERSRLVLDPDVARTKNAAKVQGQRVRRHTKKFMERSGDDVNIDAKNFLDAYNDRTLLDVCAVCGTDEEPRRLLALSDEVMCDVIQPSKLKDYFAHVIRIRENCPGYVACLGEEFDAYGLLKHTSFICISCHKTLAEGVRKSSKRSRGSQSAEMHEIVTCDSESDDSSGASAHDSDAVRDSEDCDSADVRSTQTNTVELTIDIPTTAYVRGLYPGIVPSELSVLTLVEISMVSIYNPITRIKLAKATYYHGKANMFSIVNDLTRVAESLPHMPTIDSFAVLVYKSETIDKELKYRPYHVQRALEWLVQHNHLYKSVLIQYPNDWEAVDPQREVEVPTLPVGDDDEHAIDSVHVPDATRSGPIPTNTGTTGGDFDTLLAADENIVEDLQRLKRVLQPESQYTRDISESKSVNVYQNPDHYWEKCFPTLYPYGYGGPSDSEYAMKKVSVYNTHVLKRGGGLHGRRFQNNSGSIFAMYTYEMKRHVGGVVFAASKNDPVIVINESQTDDTYVARSDMINIIDCLSESKDGETIDLRANYDKVQEKRGNGGGSNIYNNNNHNNDNSSTGRSSSFFFFFFFGVLPRIKSPSLI